VPIKSFQTARQTRAGLNQATPQEPGTLPALPARGYQFPFPNFHGASSSETHRAFFGPQSLQDSVFEPELETKQFRSHRYGRDISRSLLISNDRAGDDQFVFSRNRLPKDPDQRAVNAGQSAEQKIPDRDGILERLHRHVPVAHLPWYVCVPGIRRSRHPFAFRNFVSHLKSQQPERSARQISKPHLNPQRANEVSDFE
jgi:hypothetical protein